MNLQEALNQLKHTDEVTLLELLEVTSDDLVEAFLDKIEDNYHRILKYLHEQN